MDAGIDTFALDIPPNFQRDLLAGRAPTIQLNVDATRMSQAFSGGGYIQSIISSEVSEYLNRYRGGSDVPVDLTLRSRFNQELNKGWFGAITNVISSITMLSIVLTGAALIREREHGTIEHLLVMPVTPTEIMLSKISSSLSLRPCRSCSWCRAFSRCRSRVLSVFFSQARRCNSSPPHAWGSSWRRSPVPCRSSACC